MLETQTAPSPAHPPAAEPTVVALMESTTAPCEVCGNHYRRTFEVSVAGGRHIFDCFECAIERLAPRCAHCGCRVIGHGVEHGTTIYCCDHCCRNGPREAIGSGKL